MPIKKQENAVYMDASKIPWDDLRTVLAIAETRSLAGAQRKLGVTHATVFRRLQAIENRLGVQLFERRKGGYSPTSAGEDIAAVASRIESEVLGLERRVLGRDRRVSGTVRATTTDTLLFGLLSHILTDFRVEYPDILLDVAVSNHLLDLSKHEADLAIAPIMQPPETLIGRKVGTIKQAIYGRSDIFASPTRRLDGTAVYWVTIDERTEYKALDRWMEKRRLVKQCCFRVDTLMGMWAAVRDGMGLGVLPCYLCDTDPSLIRFGESIPEMSTDLWLLTHPDLRNVIRIRTLLDFISDSLTDFQFSDAP